MIKDKECNDIVCGDEVVAYLAGRYHTTPEAILHCYRIQEGIAASSAEDSSGFRLEPNEMRIMRDLIKTLEER